MSTIREQLKTTFLGLAGLLSKMNVMQGTNENANITDINEKVQQIIGANILQPNLQGITFADGYATDNVADIVVEQRKWIKKIASDNATTIAAGTFSGNTVLYEIDCQNATSIGAYGFQGCNNLREANFPNITSIGTYGFQGCSGITSINFQNLISIGQNAFANCSGLVEASLPKLVQPSNGIFATCTRLRKLDLSQMGSFPNSSIMSSATSLIDITIGANIRSNVNFNTLGWNPTNAYSNTSNTLVPDEVLTEHPEWKNRDYFRYCLREHFAANLEDRSTASTQYTLTFNTNMKNNAIANDDATLHAFIDKGWIVA